MVADAPVEQADEVQAVQLELQTAVQVQEALAVCHGPPREVELSLFVYSIADSPL